MPIGVPAVKQVIKAFQGAGIPSVALPSAVPVMAQIPARTLQVSGDGAKKPKKFIDPISKLSDAMTTYDWLLRYRDDKPEGLFGQDSELSQITDIYETLSKLEVLFDSKVKGSFESVANGDFFVDLTTFIPNYNLSKELPGDMNSPFKYILLYTFGSTYVVATNTPSDPSLKDVLYKRIPTQVGLGVPKLVFVQATEESLFEHMPKVLTAAKSTVDTMTNRLMENSTSNYVQKSDWSDEVCSLAELLARFESSQQNQQSQMVPKYLLDVVLAKAYSPDDPAKRASDVHIQPGPPGGKFSVRCRIGGKCQDGGSGDMKMYPQLASAIKGACPPMVMNERGKLQDGRYQMRLRVKDAIVKLDFRVTCMPHGAASGGDALEKFVFRILDSTATRPTLSQLVCGDVNLEKLMRQALQLPHGMILLTGPTGCGKSTTLSSFVLELAQDPAWTIFTVEDPIEYEYEDKYKVTQVQLDEARGITFPNVLRGFLRADPDILLVGEMRDEETASLAVRASLTGHQVLSTLHTNDAPGAVARLLDMGIKPYFVADTVIMVVAQRLVSKLCVSCRQPIDILSAAVKQDLPEEFHEGNYFRPVGCPKCHGLGFNGRVTVIDIMFMDDNLRYMIANNKPMDEIRSYNEKVYSPGLFKRALYMAKKGVIDLQTAISIRDSSVDANGKEVALLHPKL